MSMPARVACDGSAAITSTSFATRKRSIAFALTSRIILRGGRTTQRTSRERYLPKQGGFETRPYHGKERPRGTHGLPLRVKTGKTQDEHMFSGLPRTAGIGERDCHLLVWPIPAIVCRASGGGTRAI